MSVGYMLDGWCGREAPLSALDPIDLKHLLQRITLRLIWAREICGIAWPLTQTGRERMEKVGVATND